MCAWVDFAPARAEREADCKKAGHSALAMDIQGIALSMAEQRRSQWRS